MNRGSAYFWELAGSGYIADGIRSDRDSVLRLHAVIGFRLIAART